MKRLVSFTALLVAVAVAAAPAQQGRKRLYSNPDVPAREVLDRLNLKMGWRAFVPTDGRRDSILSVQMAPLRDGKQTSLQMLVQTRSGFVTVLNAETGQAVWKRPVGRPYTADYALGFNDTVVVAARGTDVFGLDRRTGDTRWKLDRAAALSAAPVVGNRLLYLTQGTREVAYYELSARGEGAPRLFQSYRSDVPLEMRPREMGDLLVVPSAAGSVTVLFKEIPKPLVRYATRGRILAPPGVHAADATVYIGSDDANLYFHDVARKTDEEPWRFSAGGAIYRGPVVNDEDVYVVAEGNGLYRLRRLTLEGPKLLAYLQGRNYITPAQALEIAKELGKQVGDAGLVLTLLQRKGYLSEEQRLALKWRGGESIWQNKDAERFIAANPKFVYATDRSGRFLVLDRDRGTELSRYAPFRDYVFPVTNELTDRVYLAANSGLIVCLHDKDYDKPVRMKTLPEPAAPAPPGNGQPAPAPGGKAPPAPGGGVPPARR